LNYQLSRFVVDAKVVAVARQANTPQRPMTLSTASQRSVSGLKTKSTGQSYNSRGINNKTN